MGIGYESYVFGVHSLLMFKQTLKTDTINGQIHVLWEGGKKYDDVDITHVTFISIKSRYSYENFG